MNRSDFMKKESFYYPFYGFDVGNATSAYTPIEKGIGIKEFEHGIIAYNITRKDKIVSLPHGVLTIPSNSGLMCKYVDDNKFSCQ